MIRQRLFRNMMCVSLRRTARRCYSSTQPNRRQLNKDSGQRYKSDPMSGKGDMPPLMDFLRDLHKDTRKNEDLREVDPGLPPPPEIENEYDYHDSTLSDDLRSESRRRASMYEDDTDVKLLRKSELDQCQMMSQNDVRRRNKLLATSHSSSAARGNQSVIYKSTTTSDIPGSYTSSTTTIVSCFGDYNSDVGEDFDDDRAEEWVGDSKGDHNMIPAEVLPAKSASSNDTSQIPTAAIRESSSSSWSVSLNDEQGEITSKEFTQIDSANDITFEKADQNNEFFYLDSDNLAPRLTKTGVEKGSQLSDLDDTIGVTQDKKFGSVDSDLDDNDEETDFFERFGEDTEGMDGRGSEVKNVSRYRQVWNDQLAPRKLENWWDRDVDLVKKAKRRSKLETLRNAQKNPLFLKCKTCPICKREWKGHHAMLSHVLNKGACFNELDETLKAQLIAQSVDLKKKRKKKKTSDYPSEF